MTASGSGIEQPAVVQFGGSFALPPELPQADKNTSSAILITADNRPIYIKDFFITHYTIDIVNVVNTSTGAIPRNGRTNFGWGFNICE